MKVAVIQLNSSNKKDENIAKANAFVETAARKGAKFVLLPEVFSFRGMVRFPAGTTVSRQAFIQEVAEKIPGKAIQPLMQLARKHKIHILAGSIYEKSAQPDKAYNSSVLLNPQGQIQVKYRKLHLFNAVVGKRRIYESDYFLEGGRRVLTKINGFSVGLSICYDLRFPELYRHYFENGANLFCVPSAFTKATGKAHWYALLKARAIENLGYVLAPNQAGKDSLGRECYGHSLIIDPWGEVLAEASADKEEIIYADIDLDVVKKRRQVFGIK